MNPFQKFLFLFISGLFSTILGFFLVNSTRKPSFIFYTIAGICMIITASIFGLKNRVKKTEKKSETNESGSSAASFGIILAIRILSIAAGLITLSVLTSNSMRYDELRMIGILIFIFILAIIILSFVVKTQKKVN